MGFYKIKTNNLADQKIAGDGILAVSKSAFSTDPNSEWAKFDGDTRKWLFDHNYRFINADGTQIGDGKIPPDVDIVPVYDTAKKMHVRIPWRGDLAEVEHLAVVDEASYGNSFPAFLGRYFMRRCR